MELGIPVLSREETNKVWTLVTTPRGATLTYEDGTTTRLPYGFVSVQGAFDGHSSLTTATEGMNEFGLTVSVQTLRRATYEARTRGDAKQALSFGKVAAYLLGSCGAAADVERTLRAIRVEDDPVLAATFKRAHWTVADANGTSLVVEYLDGALKVFDNSRVGVLTNDPQYERVLRRPTLEARADERDPGLQVAPRQFGSVRGLRDGRIRDVVGVGGR
jgi:choloylglycine hydrolase